MKASIDILIDQWLESFKRRRIKANDLSDAMHAAYRLGQKGVKLKSDRPPKPLFPPMRIP